MKILFLSQAAHFVFDDKVTRSSGGAELQVALLALEIAKRGHEVVIAAGDFGQPDTVCYEGVRVRNAGKYHTGRIMEMVTAIPRVAAVLREERPEWVCVMGWTAWLFVLWVLRPFLGFRLDFICALDSEINGAHRRERPVLGGLFEFAVRRCDARHAITEAQRACFLARGMDATLYRYLLMPVARGSDTKKTVNFLWVSRCQPIKRPELFLKLAAAIPDASFEMICPAENRQLWEKIEQVARTLPNLNFIESVPYNKIQDHYNRAEVFVNTSEWEGWPNSFIQAGLGHAALLSLDVNPDGIFETFQPGVFAGGDFAGMLVAARRMMGDAIALKTMQDGCSRFVCEMHDNDREAGVFLEGLQNPR